MHSGNKFNSKYSTCCKVLLGGIILSFRLFHFLSDSYSEEEMSQMFALGVTPEEVHEINQLLAKANEGDLLYRCT